MKKPSRHAEVRWQPPSRGCVLKQLRPYINPLKRFAAAFARLCVETIEGNYKTRLISAAAFARLCVETAHLLPLYNIRYRSRLRAAVC